MAEVNGSTAAGSKVMVKRVPDRDAQGRTGHRPMSSGGGSLRGPVDRVTMSFSTDGEAPDEDLAMRDHARRSASLTRRRPGAGALASVLVLTVLLGAPGTGLAT